MIKIERSKPETEQWQAWRQKCARQRERILNEVAEGKKPKVSDVYKAEKETFISVYGGRCGWCEKKVTSAQLGQIDHYRPKAGVSDTDWANVQFSRGGRSGDHIGYYWLAYDDDNLVYCCQSCNQVAPGRQWGKGTRFPVIGFRAEEPGEEAQEEPVLLHPCLDDPAEHLVVDRTGVMTVVNDSERGRATISLLGLNERGLPAERADVFNNIMMRFDYIMAQRHERGLEATMTQLQNLKQQVHEFAAVVQEAFRQSAREYELLAKAA